MRWPDRDLVFAWGNEPWGYWVMEEEPGGGRGFATKTIIANKRLNRSGTEKRGFDITDEIEVICPWVSLDGPRRGCPRWAAQCTGHK